MKALALVAVMLAGCASASGADQALARIEQRTRKLEHSEQVCIDDAAMRGDRQIAMATGAPAASSGEQIRKIEDQRDRRISECRAIFDRERDDLSAGERAAYEAQGHEEQNRESLIAILTAARPR
jgi:hypothetical protein